MSANRRHGRINVRALVVLMFVTALLGGGLVAAHDVRKRSIAGQMSEAAQAALSREDWPEACKYLKRYLYEYPDDVEMLEEYARAQLAIRPHSAERMAVAASAYRRLLRHRPEDLTAARQLLRLSVRLGEFERAVLSYEHSSHREDPECTLWWARAMVALRRGPQAGEGLKALVERLPNQIDAWLMLCQIELQPNTEAARLRAFEWLESALAHNPKSAQVRVRRAWFFRAVGGDRDRARAELLEAEALSCENPGVRREMAEEWLNLGEIERAADHLAVLERVTDDELYACDLDPAAFALSRFQLASRICIVRADVAAASAVADRGLAELNGPARVLFLPTAVELYVNARRSDEARRVLDEYRETMRSAGAQVQVMAESIGSLEALVLLGENKPYHAIQRLEDLLARNRNYAQSWKLLAQAFEMTDQRGRAARALEEYLLQQPRDLAAALRLAQMCAGSDWTRTLRYASQAERGGVDPLGASLLRIEAQFELGRESAGATGSDTLLAEIDTLRTEHPTSAPASILHARVLASRGRPQEAIAALQGARDVAEDPWAVSLELARIHADQGQIDRAVETCRGAIERHPDIAESRIALAEFQALQGCTDEARESLRSAVIELQGGERSRAALAWAEHLLAAGERSGAVEVLEQVAGERPGDLAPRLLLLALPEIQADAAASRRLIDEIRQTESERGLRWKVEEAWLWLRGDEWKSRGNEIIQTLTRCIDAEPTWPSPALALARLHELREDLDKAEQTYRTALGAMPMEAGLVTRLLELLERQRRYEAAAEVLERFGAAAADLSGHRVRIALGRQDYEGAINELRRRVALDPNDALSRVWLARLLYGTRGDFDTAAQLLDSAAVVAPELPSILAARVSMLHSAGRADEARRLLDGEVQGRGDYNAFRLRADYFAATEQPELAESDYQRLCTFSDRVAEGHAALGAFYEKQGKHDQALAAWRDGLKRSPDSYELKQHLVQALLDHPESQEQAEGRRLLDDLLKLRPNDPDLLYARATTLLKDEGPESQPQAGAMLERAVRIAPYHVPAHLALVRLARERGDRQKAGELAVRGLACNPRDPDLRLAAAKVEAESGNVATAWEMARRVAEADPRSVPARNLLVALALKSGEHATARTLNDEVLGLAPNDGMAQLARAEILSRDGRRAEAIRTLEAYLDGEPGRARPEHVLLLAHLHRLEGDLAASARWIDEAARIAPRDASVELARLQWLASSAEYDEIIRRLDAHDPASVDLRLLASGASLLAASDEERYLRAARRLFEQIIALDPQRSEGHLGIAQVSYRLGDLDLARQAYERVLALEPCHQQALNDLAWILGHDFNAPRQGLELANKALLQYPNDPHLLDTRGVLHLMLDRIYEARRDFEKCIEVSQDVPRTGAHARLHLGRLFAKRGDLASARTHMLEALELDRQHGIFRDMERSEIEGVLAAN